ncbi:MAG: hypothetical protein LBD28_02570 [Tannerellaceae bacterium]|jgi:hypothetical protein|nr:hypothetical protein [Tannerellaceae bacterium]
MKVTNKHKGIIAILLVSNTLSLGNLALHAQATIGSNELPARAALLDLKTRDAINPPNANDTLNISSLTGGLLLPRVKLINSFTLEPFISTSDPDWTNNSSSKIKEKHAGLTVFNISNNKPPLKVGAYIWNGYSWMTPAAKPVTVGHGIAMSGNNMQLNLQLSQSIAFNTAHELRINGSAPMNVTMPVRLRNAFQYSHNAPKKEQVIMSDAYGNAIWKDNNTIPVVAPVAKFDPTGGNVFLYNRSNVVDTKARITLPPGRWLVMVTMLAGVTSGGTDQCIYWIESTFFKDATDVFDPSIFVGNNNKISGHVFLNYNIISGYVIIENKSKQNADYVYKVTRTEVIYTTKKNNGVHARNFGGEDHWSENSIVAFALVP